jgi:uncharacterized protein YndB with AHSA1/START domain
MVTTLTDRIDKKTLLRAPRERVWRAISDAKQFGSWFGIAFESDFVAGARMVGRIVPSTLAAEVAGSCEDHADLLLEFQIDRIEPMRLFSYRWHPYAVDPDVDYSKETMTLVVFTLEDVPGGTLLTVTESGFDRIPLARRAAAFSANEGGWSTQVQRIEKYLALPVT